MPRRPREEDEDEHYDASSVGSGRSQRSRVDGGAAADAPSEEAILAALEQETSSAQEEADILKEGADVKRFLLKQNNDVKQGTCAPSPISPPMLVVLNQSSFLIAYLSLHQKRKKVFLYPARLLRWFRRPRVGRVPIIADHHECAQPTSTSFVGCQRQTHRRFSCFITLFIPSFRFPITPLPIFI